MKYVIKKIITMLITVLFVSFFVFLAFELIPGDAAVAKLGTNATPEKLEALREQMGLNRPFLIRYFSWIKDFIVGDMGQSYSYSMSVRSNCSIVSLFLSIQCLRMYSSRVRPLISDLSAA